MYQYLKYLAVALFVFSFCSSASSKIIIDEKISYYQVKGNSGQAIEKSIRRHRIKGSASYKQIGLTRTKMTVKNILWKNAGGKCSVKQGDIILNIEYIVPRWQKTKNSSARLNKNWKKFSNAVITHEKMHGKIWIDIYSQLHKRIRNLSFRSHGGKSGVECTMMRSKIKALLRKSENMGDNRNEKFERKEMKLNSVISRAFLNVVATK